ncbi:hypothetical protein [Streptomyces sp. NBC_00102]|uniref:hypothetical protein n=1 Tax=Streptomyces sp. NBC_00102 TaxID=2975652 RepID=UPI002255FB2A|nr:hypothetical protein [Streptomyces sp. NBC_00102]MCX5399282.1 hypothetical protein [Streptomyces sp. NBC_00102]
MSKPNPYADDPYTWGPPQQGSHEPTMADGQGYGYPAGGPPAYGYPQPLPESAAQPGPAYGYPAHGQQPTLGANPPAPHQGYGGGQMLSIGDIAITNDSVVTPSGTMPLKGAVWTATDMSRTEEKIPTVAIVLAIIFALLCLVGLLFLLMKEKRTTGFIQVTVTSGGRHHSTMIPARDMSTFPMVMAQVNSARAMSV